MHLLANWRRCHSFALASGLAAAALLLTCALPARADKASQARKLQTQGQMLFERGDFSGAADRWRAAVALYKSSGEFGDEARALADLGAAYQSQGRIVPALTALQSGLDEATARHDNAAIMTLCNNLGSLHIFLHEPEFAEINLRRALALAEKAGDGHSEALVWNNLGNLMVAQDQDAAAREDYGKCIALSAGASDSALNARATMNLAALAARTGDTAQAVVLDEAVGKAAAALPASHAKAQLLLASGHLARSLADAAAVSGGADGDAGANALLARAADADSAALGVATEIGDMRCQSLALGYLGELSEHAGRTGEALELAHRARFLAQECQSPSLLYLWEWQIGRLLRARGDMAGALNAYGRAVTTLQSLGDCTTFNDDPSASFRETVAPLYYQYADLLLLRADASTNAATVHDSIVQARDTIEGLKTAEIGDYFQDSCVTLGLSKVRDVEAVLGDGAVIYYIPLPDRIEILLDTPAGLRRFSSPLGANALMARARRLRLHLERTSSDAYLPYARELYDDLIRPELATLRQAHVKSLIFVPDGALRLIPMAALNDGQKFLIEEFSIGLTPGLTLMDPQPLQRGPTTLFAGGVSEAVRGFAALTHVPEELNDIARSYATHPLLNAAFTKNAVEQQIGNGSYSIVHIASHGEFSSNPRHTYLLTYDGTLNLDELESVIRPHQFQGVPVELLVLSACQTAAGDDRAALGLAGLAVKSGARAALATLWSVSDEATTDLMDQFYSILKRDPGLSKAGALQQAQLALLHDRRFAHPAFWAPYLIIGNWL